MLGWFDFKKTDNRPKNLKTRGEPKNRGGRTPKAGNQLGTGSAPRAFADLRRAAGSVVAPGFVVSPRPSGACFGGVCRRLGGFPVPDRKAYWWVPSPSGLKKYPGSRKCSSFSSLGRAPRRYSRDVVCRLSGENQVLSAGFFVPLDWPCFPLRLAVFSLPFASPRCLAASPRGSNDIAACFRESRLTCS